MQTIEVDVRNAYESVLNAKKVLEAARLARQYAEIQLDGEHAPRTTTFEFRSLPPGTYEVKATLLGSDGAPLATVRHQMNVIATGSH